MAYFTSGSGKAGCTGAMSYYTAGGEPPGRWAGQAAAGLGLSGEVDPGVIKRLYQDDIAPTGELLSPKRTPKSVREREDAAVAAYAAAHPFASAVELAQVRVAERGKDPHKVPYFDVTIMCVKSVSVLHASYRVAAEVARKQGDDELANQLDGKADRIEAALYEVALAVLSWLERHGCYTRTGYHSSTTGEWRDGDGFAAALFLHHISRDGDPHLHVHIPVLNRVQRDDGADQKWRTLDSRTLHAMRLGAAALADRLMETKLTAMGLRMVEREDGNGAEVGGVSREVMETFSSRAVAVTGELKRLAEEYERAHGKPPSARTLWLLHQQAGQNTRKSTDEAKRTVAGKTGSAEPTTAERLAAWERQTTAREVQALSDVHEAAEAFARQPEPRAKPVLDADAKARAARIAVAGVQQHHAVWGMPELRFEVHRALPVFGAHTDAESLITEVSKLAVGGRAGTEVVQVTAPDVADVSPLGVRSSDGGSVYRPPREARYATLGQLNTEEQILATAKRQVPQLVSEATARAEVAKTNLNPEQADAVVKMLTATSGTVALVAPAGSGKSHTVAVFAGIWTRLTGKRVIGLTTSTNAARVLQSEGLRESYNTAEFLGKVKGSDELRRPVPVHENDVLVLDEATQVSTADFAMVQEAARQAGARLNPVGDTQQLGAVDAGGMFRLVAQEVPAAELHEIRRFDAQWERDAALLLRDGDMAAFRAYDARGRIRGGDEEAAYERAASLFLADHLAGREALLLAGTNAEAAELARRVQEKLVSLGTVGEPVLPLSDGNSAGRGDLVRARLNTTIDAGGQVLSNRDRVMIEGCDSDAAQARRQRLDGTWTGLFSIPRAYLERDAELDYAGNTHVAEGRTVDVGHLLVTPSLSREAQYVGLTRGRLANYAHVVTGQTAPEGREPYEQATAESVIKSVMQREAADLSATEQIRQSQEWAGGTGHVLKMWSASVRGTVVPEIDRLVKARLTPAEAARYDSEHSRRVLQEKLRGHQLDGHDMGEVIERITAAPLDGARSVSSVLHGRLERLNLERGEGSTWQAKTPESAPELAHELAEALDERHRELGERQVQNPEPWLLNHLGALAPDASPALREDYARRAATVAAYREAAGITDPGQAVARDPHGNSPELESLRGQAMNALEMIAEPERYLSRGELEARVLDGKRAGAAAPEDVSSRLRLATQAEMDARAQAANAQARQDQQGQLDAEALAGVVGADRTRLDALQDGYEGWSSRTQETRLRADEAQRELQRRGLDEPRQEEEPHDAPEADPWETLDRDLEAAGRALDRERAEVEAQGETWPPPNPRLEEVREKLAANREAEERQLALEFPVTDEEVERAREHDQAPEPVPPDRSEEPQEEIVIPRSDAEWRLDNIRDGQLKREQDERDRAPEPRPEPVEAEEPAQPAQPQVDEPAAEEAAPEPTPEPEVRKPDPAPAEQAELASGGEASPDDGRADRLDALQAQADEAAARLAADRADAEVRAEYAARQEMQPEPSAEYEADEIEA